MGSVEESWQAFFANPVDWWDNRKNKVLNLGVDQEGSCIYCAAVIIMTYAPC